MTAAVRFAVTCTLFHAGALVLWGGAAWWWARQRRRGGPERPLAAAVAGAAVLGGTTLALAAACSAFGPLSGFTLVRLLAQALFGEAVLLGAAMVAVEARASPRRAAALAVWPIALLAVYWDAYHREPHALHVRTHELDLSQGPPRGTLRLLHLSDLQCDRVGPYEERVLEEARRRRPDVVVWTGDYVQPRLAPTRRETTARLRQRLAEAPIPATLGSFAVRGDVDADFPGPLAGTGIVPLVGETARIALPGGRTLALAGLLRTTSRGRDLAGVVQALASCGPDDLCVVAGHNPSFVRLLPEAPTRRPDLVLAGHTHGGQVVLPLFGAPYTKTLLPREYASGLHSFQGTPLHVSAGIGMERGMAPQIRFLCPPEICLLVIHY